ncbi:MAG: methyltransferase domain-containing protein [Myxococcales bacterium]|nr:methyltransferase domain-containing protein [Myxococcales bacterium]
MNATTNATTNETTNETTNPTVVTRSMTAHERAVSAMYGREAKRWSALRARMGQKDYSTWGFWSDDTADMNQACDTMIREIAAAAAISPGHRVLDVGCGAGASTMDLARLTHARELVGIDITHELLVHASAATEREGLAGVRFERMSATQLIFADQVFDRVIAVDCASHFDPRDGFFAEAARVLRPGGRAVLLDLVLGGPPVTLADKALMKLLLEGWRLPKANCYDATAYAERVAAAGFREVVVRDVSERVLPGATRHMLSESYQRAFVAVFGGARAAMWRLVLRAIARAQRAGLVKFILVTAERP